MTIDLNLSYIRAQIGAALKIRRRTLRDLAEALGLSYHTLAENLRQDGKAMTVETLLAIMSELGWTIETNTKGSER